MTPRGTIQLKLSRDRINVRSWKDDVGLHYSVLEGFSDHIVLNVIWATSDRNTDFWKGIILHYAAEIITLTVRTATPPNSSSLAAPAAPWHKLKTTCSWDHSPWNIFATEIATSSFPCLYLIAKESFCSGGLQKKTGRLIMLTQMKFGSLLKINIWDDLSGIFMPFVRTKM